MLLINMDIIVVGTNYCIVMYLLLMFPKILFVADFISDIFYTTGNTSHLVKFELSINKYDKLNNFRMK